MQKLLYEGLITGFIAAIVGSGVTIVIPNNIRATILGTSLGAIATSTAFAKRHRDELKLLESELQEIQVSLPNSEEDEDTFANSTSEFINPSLTSPATKPYHLRDLETQANTPLLNWFSDQSISIEPRSVVEPQVDEIFNRHAIYLGNHLKDEEGQPLLTPLLKQIKWAIAKKRRIQYHLRNKSQLQIKTNTEFCHRLYEDTLLSYYRYIKSERVIHAELQDRGDIRSFFNGDWFERFVAHQVSQSLQHHAIPYSCLLNPVVKFTNGDRFELDLVFFFNGAPLLIECKTGGDFNAHLNKSQIIVNA
jgi:hypothetical protein